MIKIYLDWNVLTQIKNGKHGELKEVIIGNESLFIPFSTSHIGDIISSFKDTEEQRAFINSDLDFITQITGNKCLANNGTEIILDYRSPHDLFQESIDEKELFTDISLDGLGKIFDENEEMKDFSNVFKSLMKSISLEEHFKEAFENPESAEQMEKMFPGLKDNPTMEGFFQSFNKMNIGLNEKDTYNDLRQIVQSGLGINRDKIIDSKDPYRMIEKEYKKLGVSGPTFTDNKKNAPEWFNEITNEYLILDMHGYQEDKVNIKKGRKETFKNTTEDAFHCAFASTCNLYITNDDKSYKKTKKVYEKLKIDIPVLKPNEFVDFYRNYLHFSNEWDHLLMPLEIIKKREFFESKIDGITLRTYFFPYFLFNFFNKILILIPDNEDPVLLLSRNVPDFHKVYSMEVRLLVNKISILLGEDVEKYGEVTDEEFLEESWRGRNWELNSVKYKLIRSNGHFQFYLDYK